MPDNQALSRIKTNLLLEEAGWRFFDTAEGMANNLPENQKKIIQKVEDAWDNDFEKTAVDYKYTAAGPQQRGVHSANSIIL